MGESNKRKIRKKLIIKVTQENIDKSREKGCSNCVIQPAIDAIPTPKKGDQR